MEYIKYVILCLGFGSSSMLMLLGAMDSSKAIAALTVGFCFISWLMEGKR